MDEHFRAFSFVDRISSVQDGTRILGQYAIPSGVSDFPTALVAEAVGQLAAWGGMAAVDFEQRPVAGLARSIELMGEARPAQILELSVDLECVDREAVAYSGEARTGGSPVIRLHDCVGPMMPVIEFDDPQALRKRFGLLCGPGAPPGGFEGLPPLALAQTASEPGQCARASFQVPSSAALFADHFPRRPVFPGSLMMHVHFQLTASLANEIPPPNGGRWTAASVLDMKLRSFIPPGVALELEAKVKNRSTDSVLVAVETRAAKEVIGTARMLLKLEDHP